MELFNTLKKIAQTASKAGNISENILESIGENIAERVGGDVCQNSGKSRMEELSLSSSSRIVEDTSYWEDTVYHISFQVNDSFKETASHAGEIEMLYTYAPNSEYGQEGELPYLAIQSDDTVYLAVEAFKEKGTFAGAVELMPLSGKFYFRAKTAYYNNIMYFYGMDLCGGSRKNLGLCMVYPKSYAGTESERRLMQVLDEVAESLSCS